MLRSKLCLSLLIGVVGAFSFLGCENIPFLKPKPAKATAKAKPVAGPNTVAVVGDFVISADDLKKEIENYNALVAAQGMDQGKIDSKEKKAAYLRNDVVRRYMLYQEALDRGLDKREDLVKDLEYARMNLLVSELLREEINKIEVSTKEIEDFYNQNKDSLREPEQRKISEIVTNTEDEAKQVNIQLLQGGDFIALSKQLSKSPKSQEGGDLGFLTYELDPQKRIRFDKFYEVAFSPTLDAGSISQIFKGADGFYIIKVDGIKKSEVKPLTEIRDNIKNWLLLEKQQAAIAGLAKKLQGEIKVEVYEEKVE
ncbi:MAG: peptidyl-prolyl cis-trans isomerase [Candidatus Omnitrophota bacterium]